LKFVVLGYFKEVETVIRNAKDLSPDQRAVIESLLGRRMLEDEAISVRAIEPPALSSARREQLVEELRMYFAEVDARRKPGSEEEAEEILTEAMRSVRPGYRPHQ
jgi:hypothetical protein